MEGLLGMVVGLILGLTGAGGSILAVPVLMTGLGWSLTQAAPVALLAVCAASALGAYMAWRKSFVRYRAAALISAVGALTAPAGLWLANRAPTHWLEFGFSTVMTLVAIRMIHQSIASPRDTIVLPATVQGDGEASRGPICQLQPNGRIQWTWACAALMAGIGAITGVLSGLFGVGGGFVIVPLLRLITPLSMQSAVATSLMAIALTSLGTVGASLMVGREFLWLSALPFAAGALFGMLGGRWLGPKVAGPRLQQGFAMLMVVIAGAMALRACGALDGMG